MPHAVRHCNNGLRFGQKQEGAVEAVGQGPRFAAAAARLSRRYGPTDAGARETGKTHRSLRPAPSAPAGVDRGWPCRGSTMQNADGFRSVPDAADPRLSTGDVHAKPRASFDGCGPMLSSRKANPVCSGPETIVAGMSHDRPKAGGKAFWSDLTIVESAMPRMLARRRGNARRNRRPGGQRPSPRKGTKHKGGITGSRVGDHGAPKVRCGLRDSEVSKALKVKKQHHSRWVIHFWRFDDEAR